MDIDLSEWSDRASASRHSHGTQIDALTAMARRIRALEQQRDSVIATHYEINTDSDGARCHECYKVWPCSTALNLSLD